MHRLLFLFVALCGSLAFAQPTEEVSPLLSDETQLDELRERFASGIPIVAAVDELAADAFGLFDAGDCAEAIPVLEDVAQQSNTLANIIVLTLEPFYSTLSSDRQATSYGPLGLDPLAEAEAEANRRKRTRNTAYVAIGECHERLGSFQEALTYYGQALELISAVRAETDTWLRAREGVYRIIGYDISTRP